MDLWVREARIFKYGSGTGSNFSAPARRRRAALRRRQVERADELPQDRRPRRRRHQVGRHHAPRRQDGRPRSRPSGHRGVRQLEGRRGAEGRRPGHRLEAAQPAPQRHPARRATRWPERRRAVRPRRKNADLRKADRSTPAAALVPANYIERVHPARPAGLHAHCEVEEYDTDWNSKAYYTVSRPEQQQLGAHRPTTSWRRCETDGPWHLYWRTEKEKAEERGPRAEAEARR